MNLLRRELAPITDEAWEQIDDEARRVLKLHLAGRKLVDFSGPHGWAFGAVNLGRLERMAPAAGDPVERGIRSVLPLVEMRVPFTLPISEVDSASRGAIDLDLDPVIVAAEQLARAEDFAIFHGFGPGQVVGIIEASPHAPIAVESSLAWPRAIETAREVLRKAGIDGPYGLALGGVAYGELTSAGDDGYPIRKRVEESFAEGSFVWAPALESDAVLLSLRGGDYELVVGQDLSIGYRTHDDHQVELYITESFTFRVLEDKAAVSLKRSP